MEAQVEVKTSSAITMQFTRSIGLDPKMQFAELAQQDLVQKMQLNLWSKPSAMLSLIIVVQRSLFLSFVPFSNPFFERFENPVIFPLLLKRIW